MGYVLMILSGLLGIFGIVFETHEETEKNGKKVKVLKPWGIITVTILFALLCLSTYREYDNAQKAEVIAKENEYLKLSEITVGPYYSYKIVFSDSIFTEDAKTYAREIFVACQKAKEEYTALDPAYKSAGFFQLLGNKYQRGFIDSNSRYSLFNNRKFIKFDNFPLATIYMNAGVIGGRIDFENDGLATPIFSYHDDISRMVYKVERTGIDSIEAKLFYDRNTIYVTGKIERNVRAGTIYGSILREVNLNKTLSSFNVYFDEQPDMVTVEKLNKLLNSIKVVQFALSYDPDAIRWLIVPFKPDKPFKLTSFKDRNLKRWLFSKTIKYERLPYIGDISN